nr:metallophosphoesterase [Paenibacillus sp. GSMTC-2017]
MLIGSTECGKTTFAKEVLIPQLRLEDDSRNVRTNVQYLSSDSIRQDLLGYDYDKYDRVMLEASSHTFQLLFERLKLVTSFPINAEFVVVDTTGLAEDFRNKVRDVARESNYNLEVILFDYRKRDHYYASERSKKLITQHLTRLRKDVLPVLTREGYGKVHKVRAKDFYLADENLPNRAYKVMVEDWETYLSTVLPQENNYIVVGDVHECVLDLQELLKSHGYVIDGGKLIPREKVKDTKIILVGDWIDKGKGTRDIIEFLYENRAHFLLVLGNHENFVYKYLSGDIKGVDSELLHSYFDSTEVLRDDAALLEKFTYLVEMSKPFYRFAGKQGPSYYVTHAPCQKKYIGKLDSNSMRHQRNFRLDREAPTEEQLSFLREEAVSNHPFHLFGHVAAKQAFRIKNKLHLDTGSVHGNALTSVHMTYKPFFKSQKACQVVLDEPLPTLFQEDKKVSLKELDYDAVRRLKYSVKHGINFISGTMSPADKDEETGELESLKRGLDYFTSHGVTEVVLQPKYMGSRCNVYLHRDVADCYAVSRNGYKVSAVDMVPIYENLLNKFGDYMMINNIAVLILDGELLPWKALGDGLIQKQFKPIERALDTELSFLQKHGFEDAFGRLVSEFESSGFEKDQHHLSKSALSDKYGSHVYQTYKYVREIREAYVPLADHKEAHDVYRRQLDIYGADAATQYKPFAILKEVLENGEEQLPGGRTSDMYSMLSDDDYLVLDLNDSDAYEKAAYFFAKLTVENHMEGVVIKPEYDDSRVVPFLKVRNPDYLSIIYGYDYKFPHKYKKLIKTKNVSKKLRTSAKEHRLGQRLLSIKLNEIASTNEAYMEIAANLLFEVAKEKEIDPRL